MCRCGQVQGSWEMEEERAPTTSGPNTLRRLSQSLLGDEQSVVDTMITLSWLDVKYCIKKGRPNIFKRIFKPSNYRRWKQMEPKCFLEGILGQVRPGQLVGIMGGSGAGKTTMLNVLAGKIAKGEPTGVVVVNGKPRDPEVWPFLLSYVEQKDILDEELTVREMIQFAVDMHCSSKFQKETRKSRCDKLIKALNLEEVADRYIGDVSGGISGGERKRVSIALELAAERRLIFLDEATTGLDAGSAFDLLETLSALVKKHDLSAIMTIHQPSTALLERLDLILLMSLGKIVYFGSLQEIIDHFETLGFECPYSENPADWILDLVSVDNDDGEGGGRREEQREASLKRIAQFHQAWADIVKKDMGDVRSKRSSKIQVEQQQQLQRQESLRRRSSITSRIGRLLRRRSDSKHDDDVESGRRSVTSIFLPDRRMRAKKQLTSYPLNPFEEFGLLLKRYVLVEMRSTSANLFLFFEFLILGLVLGFIYFQLTTENFGGAQTRIGLFASIPIIIGILVSIDLMIAFCRKRELILRERFSHLYRLIDSYVANVLAVLPIRLLSVSIFATILYYLAGLRTDSFTHYLIYMGIILLITLFACFFGIFVAAISTGPEMAAVIRALCLNTFLMFAGNLARASDVTPIISWVRFITPYFYTLQSLLQNELIGLEIAGEPGVFYLELYDLNQFSIMWSAGALMILCAATFIFGFIGLYVSTKPSFKLTKEETHEE